MHGITSHCFIVNKQAVALMVLKKFFFYSRIISLWEPINPAGGGQFGPQGLDLQALCRGPLDIATYQIYKLWASLLQRFLIIRLWELYVAMTSI